MPAPLSDAKNSYYFEEAASVPYDGKCVFCKAFWAFAKIIEELRPKE